MEFILIAIVTSFNFLIIKWKVEKKRYEDAALDAAILVILSSFFGGTMGGMIIAVIASFIVSIYFLASPPKFLSSKNTEGFITEFKKRMPR